MLKNQKGFSLVELMIVVAIIGILAAIAIPNFQKFQEKSRQSEAKGSLSGIYTAEEAFYAEYTQYYSGFDIIGYAPAGVVGYDVGFGSIAPGLPPAIPTPGGAACFHSCTSQATPVTCNTNFAVWKCNELNGQTVAASAVTGEADPTAVAYVAGAIAKLNPNAVAAQFDQWTMDQNRNLLNQVSGL